MVRHPRGWALLTRLTDWLDQFTPCFGHRAQRVALREYIDGWLGDSPRKAMQAMLARVTEPRSYQAFHPFMTHAPWDPLAVWRRLLAVVPDHHGVLILDDTPFLTQGHHSVGVAKQYVSTLKKVAHCQVAVTAALWTGGRGWLVGAEWSLPEIWLIAERAVGAVTPHRDSFSHLPPETSIVRLARVIHQRWAIEQPDQDLKTERGLDHCEGRRSPGWPHQVALSAVASGVLQPERRRSSTGPRLTFPPVRAIAQEIFTGVLFITRDRDWTWLQRGRQMVPLRI